MGRGKELHRGVPIKMRSTPKTLPTLKSADTQLRQTSRMASRKCWIRPEGQKARPIPPPRHLIPVKTQPCGTLADEQETYAIYETYSTGPSNKLRTVPQWQRHLLGLNRGSTQNETPRRNRTRPSSEVNPPGSTATAPTPFAVGFLLLKVVAQPLKDVSMWPPRSPTSNLTIHFSPAPERTQVRMSFLTSLEVLSTCWAQAQPVVNLAALKNKAGSEETHFR